MEKKQENIQVIVFDDQEYQSPIKQPKKSLKNDPLQNKKQQKLVIFDQDEIFEEEIYLEKKQKLKKQQFQRKMSRQQYTDKCKQLQNRIVFNNILNGKIKQAPKKNFISQLKQKRRESQNNFRKSSLMSIQDIMQIPKINDVKVDFVETNKQSAQQMMKRQSKNNYICMPISLDETITTDLQSTKKSKSIGLDGAVVQQSNDIKIEELKQKSMLKVSNFRQFLYIQLKPSYQIFLKIKRTQNGFINSTFKFYFQQNSRFVLSCQKQGFSKYVFSSSQVHISEEHISYLGKMQTTLMGTQFWMYDSGQDCSKTKIMQNYKKQLVYLNYIQEGNQPRRFDTYITTCDNKSTDFTITDSKNQNILYQKWKTRNKYVQKLSTKSPSYDPQDSNYKLDFRGLVGIPSVKNFIVNNQQFDDAIIFGRQDKDTYIMRVKCPFSILQAAAIAMSSIHYKFL